MQSVKLEEEVMAPSVHVRSWSLEVLVNKNVWHWCLRRQDLSKVFGESDMELRLQSTISHYPGINFL